MASDSEATARRRKRGSQSHTEGHKFEEQVAELYELLGYSVEIHRGFDGREIDLFLTQKIGDIFIYRAIECKQGTVKVEELDSFIAKLKLVRREYPNSIGAIVTLKQFTPGVASHAAREGISLTRFRELEGALIDGHGYCRSMVQEIELNDTYQLDRFIEPQIVIEGGSPHPAFDLINRWLSDGGWNQLTLLGDVGTGKSFLTRYIAHRLAQSYLKDPIRSPLPIRIDLRETDRHLSLEGLILTHFASTQLRTTRFDVFQHFLAAGRAVLILDGFDEMAARINPRTTIRNFYELTRAVTGQAKVLITCRTHYFKSKSHEEEVLLGETPSVSTQDARELYWDIISRKGYKIAYLQPFSLREIELFVQKALGDQADAAISRIQKTYNLMELSQRPMLLEMIVKSIQSLRGKEINAATLYGVYTDAWIHRDRWRDLLNSTAKLDFVFALARILWSEDLTCVHHSRLSAYIESHFSSQGEHDAFAMVELDSEIRTATFLTRDSSGNYGFAHKSYLEYFLARSVAQNLTMDVPQNALQLRRLSPEVLRFLVQLIRDSKTEPSLEKLICSPYQADISENGLLLLYELRQSQTANEEMVVMPDFIQMRSAKLQQVALSKAVLRSADFSEAFLAESVFSSCDLSGSNFEGAGLQNANLANTRAVSARFRRAKADRCDFQKCNLANADFQEATARSAVFFEAILTNASFEKSDTLGTVFDTAIDPPAAVPATTAFQSLDASVWSAVQQYSLWYSNKFQIDIDDLISSALYTIVNDNRNMEEEMKQDPSAIKSLVRTIAAKERDRMLERFHKRGAIQNVEIDAFDFIGGEEAIEYLPESVLSTGSSDIERRVLVNEILTIMRSLLSDTAYEMINLRFIHGLSDQEIGKIYNSTPTTVSRQIHSALALVRAKLFKDVASDGFASF